MTGTAASGRAAPTAVVWMRPLRAWPNGQADATETCGDRRLPLNSLRRFSVTEYHGTVSEAEGPAEWPPRCGVKWPRILNRGRVFFFCIFFCTEQSLLSMPLQIKLQRPARPQLTQVSKLLVDGSPGDTIWVSDQAADCRRFPEMGGLALLFVLVVFPCSSSKHWLNPRQNIG